MRILVVSDSHGDEYALRQAVEEQSSARVVIHLGDGLREAETVAAAYPDKKFYIIKGNNDWGDARLYAETGLTEIAGRRVFYTHGHHYGVKMGYYRVICAAREQKADILLFGHTHESLIDYDEGLTILNPGSVAFGCSTYGFIDITEAGVVPQIVKLRA